MAIGTGTVKLSEIISEFGTNTTYGPNNLRSYLKCGGSVTVNTYSTPGTGSITAPVGATRVRIKVWGAGGGGGPGRWYSNAGEGFFGGGGGSGAYAEKYLTVTGGSSQFFYSIGAGGTGGTLGTPATSGGNSRVEDVIYGGTFLLEAGGGGPGLRPTGEILDDGQSGAGGITYAGADISVPGENSGSPFGGDCPDGGAGAPPNQGTTIDGFAPGGGGGGGAATSSIDVLDGTNGAAGRVQFIWYGAGVPEHENNASIPSSGTPRISNYRSSGSSTIDKDFVSDTYTGSLSTYISPDFSFTQTRSGLCTAAATAALGLNFGTNTNGSKGNIDIVGRTISTLNETSVLNSIFDWSSASVFVPPNSSALVLNGDRRSSAWTLPWISVSVTLGGNTITLNRVNSRIPAGQYNATQDVTYWLWDNQIFGFVNGSFDPYNFTMGITIL